MVAAAPDILSPLSLILESVLQADQQMMERTKAKILSALISVLQIQELNGNVFVCLGLTCDCVTHGSGLHSVLLFCQPGGDISQLPQLLLSVCETVKDEALALIDNTRHMSHVGDTVEDEDSMETDSPRGLQKDQRDGVSLGRSDGAKNMNTF